MNTILIILILLIAIGAAVLYWFKTLDIKEETVINEYDNPYDLDVLTQYVKDRVATTLRRSLKDANLTREELERAKHNKMELRRAIDEASLGNVQAKKMVKATIISMISDATRANKVDESSINKIIPFDNPKLMTPRDKFETLLYIFENTKDEKTGKKYGPNGLSVMFKLYHLDQPLPGTNQYVVTTEDINKVYKEVVENHINLTYIDKKNIVSQRIFENLYGFGPVDMLLDTSVDEVQGGVSGIPKGAYEFKSGTVAKGAKYSYESIWIVYSGLTIHLDFLSFGTQEELVRVCKNIYKYDAPNVLSQTQGRVVATMIDGSRIVVVRPIFSDSYAFLARKFDSTPSIDPAQLLTDNCSEIPILVAKWMIKGSQNIAITGDQGCGKTTFLKSMIRFIREDYAIRIQELTPELNLRYTYPERNVLSFRETDSITSQEGLDLQKKTSGSVNIIGEVATAEAASWIIQTAKVASKMTMFTHHAKTVKDLIVALRNNMMQVNNYTDNAAVDEMIATSLNLDIHLERKKGHRYLERITEIVPIRDRAYPIELIPGDDKEDIEERMKTTSLEEMQKRALVNTDEYQKRVTDRILFKGEDLVRFDEDKKRYCLVALPSKEMLADIAGKLTKEEEEEMKKDFARVMSIEKKQREKEKTA